MTAHPALETMLRHQQAAHAVCNSDEPNYELSKPDFELLQKVLRAAMNNRDLSPSEAGRALALQERFDNAHTAWIEP